MVTLRHFPRSPLSSLSGFPGVGSGGRGWGCGPVEGSWDQGPGGANARRPDLLVLPVLALGTLLVARRDTPTHLPSR